MPFMNEEQKRAQAEETRNKRHAVFRTRRVGGMTVARFSHWSDEPDPQDVPASDQAQGEQDE